MKQVLSTFFLIFFFYTGSLYAKNELPVKEIKGEEIWSGNIVIDGVVAVKKGATLKIMPGAKVSFIHKDYDDDEIGDGELYVEGKIIAVGTKERPIIFTVNEESLAPAKWKYVMVNHSKKAVFEWVVFEGAFSGLQVHFSNATVKNCIFRKNVDGFRFSTSNIFVTGCIMKENKHGIRYEERDSSGTICGNDIVDNEIGIFPVTKCKGAVNFKLNNIYRNAYSIKVGEEQTDSLNFNNNYFGTVKQDEIEKTIYDKNDDPALAKVNFKPLLNKIQRGEAACLKN